jgi:hypothetical protein
MKKCLVVIVMLVCGYNGWAQVQDPNSPHFDLNLEEDTTTTEEGSETQEGQDAPPPPKPYERIVLAVDSLTNLITYTGVVEQDESSSDSLYVRAKRYAGKAFGGGAKDPKGLYEIDKKNQKLVINAVIPAYSYVNKYNKKPLGTYQFKMTLLIKEGRYKYTITNLVHEGQKPNAGVAPRNYFEYYYTTTTNIKGVDAILRYADQDINKMLEDFKKAMKEPVLVDEDEW